MPPKDTTVERVQQRIDADLMTQLDQHPSRIQRWFIDNIFRRSLAYLVAFTEAEKAVIVRCTAGGKLKTAPTGTGFTDYKRGGQTSTDGGITVFDGSGDFYSRFDILVETNDVEAKYMLESGGYGGWSVLPKGMHSIDLSASLIVAKSRSAGSHGVVSVAGYR